MIRQKVEIRFVKGEAARFISHHDLMRAFQRAVRRAALPVRLTEGFNPRPRIVFPVALEVGVASLDEAAELELTQWIPLEELKTRLSGQMPPGLTIVSVTDLPPARKAQAPLKATYRIHLAEAGMSLDPQVLKRTLEAPAIPFERTRRDKSGRTRTVPKDLRPLLLSAELDEGGDLVVEAAVAPEGTMRPLELLSCLTGTPLETLKSVRVTKLKTTLKPSDKAT